MRRLVYLMPLALVLGVAACNDTEDYEARIATLEQDLEAARADADARVQDLTARAEDADVARERLASVEEQIAQALEQASIAVARFTEIEAAPGIEELPQQPMQEVRDNLQGVVESLQTAAVELGMQQEGAAAEPAAGEPMQEIEVEPAAGDPAQAEAEAAEEEPVQQQ